jgi:hypothetical protein
MKSSDKNTFSNPHPALGLGVGQVTKAMTDIHIAQQSPGNFFDSRSAQSQDQIVTVLVSTSEVGL